MATSGKFKKDELGTRIKTNYENRTRILLPRRTYTVIRIDGKAFHSYTKGLNRPFDDGLMHDMDETAIYLCKNIQGAKFGFVQSDEISILMTDFDKLDTDAWFDGNIQKIVSVSASMATAKFNQLRLKRAFNNKLYDCEFDGNMERQEILDFIDATKLGEFDARTFTIPSKTEVMNMFLWRQRDCIRNSISSVAQSLYSSKELHSKNMSEQQEMIFQKGANWNDYDSTLKHGRFVFKENYELKSKMKDSSIVERSRWVIRGCPDLGKHPEFLNSYIPDLP